MKVSNHITIEASVEAFIVPNSISTAQDSIYPDEKTKWVAEVLKLNGIEGVDPATCPLVEIWWVSSGDLQSDNLCDHGFTVFSDHKDRSWTSRMFPHGIPIPMSFLNYVPAILFRGHSEGDKVWMEFKNTWLAKTIEEEGRRCEMEISGTFLFEVQLAQTKYRYRNYGNFETLLELLMAHYNELK